jgi:glutaredoxin 2
MPRQANSWIRACKQWNEDKPVYCVPRRGTPQYNEIAAIRDAIDAEERPAAAEEVVPQEDNIGEIEEEGDDWFEKMINEPDPPAPQKKKKKKPIKLDDRSWADRKTTAAFKLHYKRAKNYLKFLADDWKANEKTYKFNAAVNGGRSFDDFGEYLRNVATGVGVIGMRMDDRIFEFADDFQYERIKLIDMVNTLEDDNPQLLEKLKKEFDDVDVLISGAKLLNRLDIEKIAFQFADLRGGRQHEVWAYYYLPWLLSLSDKTNIQLMEEAIENVDPMYQIRPGRTPIPVRMQEILKSMDEDKDYGREGRYKLDKDRPLRY